jgi:hypothetical protein
MMKIGPTPGFALKLFDNSALARRKCHCTARVSQIESGWAITPTRLRWASPSRIAKHEPLARREVNHSAIKGFTREA